MRILGHMILAFAKIFDLVIGIYTFIVAIAVIVSWVNPDPYNPIVSFLRQATEPSFRIARRILPRFLYRTGIDFSPLLVFIFLIFLQTFVGGLLGDLGRALLSKSP